MKHAVTALICALIAACGPSAPSAVPPTPTTTPTATTPAPEPSASLGGFACQVPVTLPGNADFPTHLTDIRIAGHEGYDRVVFQFDSGVPRVELKQGQPPFTTDPAGLPLPVDGSAFLQLTLRGASRGGSDGPTTYAGPTDFDAQLSELWQVRMAGDFEGVMTFILGLVDPPCFDLSTLEAPTRVVLDLAGQ